jgi:hypothetical protein
MYEVGGICDIYLLTAIGLSPGGSTHLQTIHKTTEITTEQHK